ncbi:MAG TPA: hypothetical protein VHW71_11075 [Steroidobacteraceae bacterium]|nr:hypothetical protein [Steroidobacteraceae bacterium]
MNGLRDLVFFTDRDLGRQFPEALRKAGLQIERHDDHFGPETLDDEWIGEIGLRGWIAITRDARIRYSPLALSVLMTFGAQLRAWTFHCENSARWRPRLASAHGLARRPNLS